MTFDGGVLAPLGRMMAALVAGAAISFAALAQEVTEPIPVPRLAARVMDSTGTLTAPERQRIEAKLQAFEQAKGSQVAVLLVPSIGPEPIEDFALRVTDAWKLGRAGVDDGVLFVIAKQQRKMRIQTGRGVQGTLTDALSKRIIAERVAPGFRNGDFAGGIEAGVDAILKAIEGEALPPPKASASRKVDTITSASDFLWIAFFAVPMVAVVLRPFVGRAGSAGLTSGLTGVGAWLFFGSILAAAIGAFVAFLVALAMGAGNLRQGRGGGAGGWIPGGFGGGGGGFGGGSGGGFSGGGGGFDGGGASGDW